MHWDGFQFYWEATTRRWLVVFNNILACLSINYSTFKWVKFKTWFYFNRLAIWGICFIYGTLFAVKGLVAAGKTYENSKTIQKACSFLLSKQLHTGGWGESYLSCETKVNTTIPYSFYIQGLHMFVLKGEETYPRHIYMLSPVEEPRKTPMLLLSPNHWL